MNKIEVRAFCNEAFILAQLHHPNIVEFYGSTINPKYSIVTE